MSNPLGTVPALLQGAWLGSTVGIEPGLQSWLEDPVALAMTFPPFVLPLFVFASALIEYVIPPYWGDLFVLLGFFLAGQGAVSPAVVFFAALTGSIVGSMIAYRLGERYGLALVHRFYSGKRRVPRQQIRDLFQRFGKKLLIVNRFLPIVRSALLYGAGALKLRFGPVIFYCALSNVAFIGLLMWAGLWTAGSWPEILATFQQSYGRIGAVVLVTGSIWVFMIYWRYRTARKNAAGKDQDCP